MKRSDGVVSMNPFIDESAAMLEPFKDFSGPTVEEFYEDGLEISPLELANLTYGTDKRAMSKMSSAEAIGRNAVAVGFMKKYNIKLKE